MSGLRPRWVFLFRLNRPPGHSGGLYLQAYPEPDLAIGSNSLAYGSFADTPALQVTYEGLAAGMIGVEEIHFVIPLNQAAGNWALFFNTASCSNGGGTQCALTAGEVSVSNAYVTLPAG